MKTEVRKISTLEELLKEAIKRNDGKKERKKTIADIYGKLKRGLDGLEYQKEVRNGDWN